MLVKISGHPPPPNVNDFATSLLNICGVSANQNLYSPRETTKIYIFVNIENRINHIFYITPYYNYEKKEP